MAFIKSFKSQQWLLPPSIEELIPSDHVCFLIESLVDSIDFSSFEIKYSGAGHPAYHPRVILKPMLMGVLDNVRSSRKIARSIRENIVYMHLAEKVIPDFRTISDFRKNNPDLIKKLFKHTVILAKQEGMLNMSCFSTDGTKIKANSSDRKNLNKDELSFLINFVDNELEKWAKQDSLEDDFFQNIRGSEELPEKNKRKMKKTVEHYIKTGKEKGIAFKEMTKKTLEKVQKEHNDNKELDKASITDTDSHFMKNKKGRIELSYNPQITTERNGFIVANDVCKSASDMKQLKPQVKEVEENLGTLPEGIKWLADKGYCSGNNIHFLNEKNIDGYIPVIKRGKKDYDKCNFSYDEKNDEYICPEKKRLTFIRKEYDGHKKCNLRIYKGNECLICSKTKECVHQKRIRSRYIRMYPYESEKIKMKEKMQTDEAREIYRLRQQTVEPVFGDIKENKGIRRFLLRGLENVKTEFNFACAAVNLRKMHILLQNKKYGKDAIRNIVQKMKENTEYCVKIGLGQNMSDLFV